MTDIYFVSQERTSTGHPIDSYLQFRVPHFASVPFCFSVLSRFTLWESGPARRGSWEILLIELCYGYDPQAFHSWREVTLATSVNGCRYVVA